MIKTADVKVSKPFLTEQCWVFMHKGKVMSLVFLYLRVKHLTIITIKGSEVMHCIFEPKRKDDITTNKISALFIVILFETFRIDAIKVTIQLSSLARHKGY